MILRAMEHRLPWVQLRALLDELESALEMFDCDKALDILIRAVAEYRPAAAIYDLVWQRPVVAEVHAQQRCEAGSSRGALIGAIIPSEHPSRSVAWPRRH